VSIADELYIESLPTSSYELLLRLFVCSDPVTELLAAGYAVALGSGDASLLRVRLSELLVCSYFSRPVAACDGHWSPLGRPALQLAPSSHSGDDEERMEKDRIHMQLDSDNTFLPYFYSNINTISNVLEYKYKMDVSNSKTHSDNYSIWKTTFTNFLYWKFTITKSCKD
jgi:hypothetical protein